jgi:hypothetical protein
MEQETTNHRRKAIYYTFRLLFFFTLGFFFLLYSLKFLENASTESALFLSFGVSILFVVITSWGLIGVTQSKNN